MIKVSIKSSMDFLMKTLYQVNSLDFNAFES